MALFRPLFKNLATTLSRPLFAALAVARRFVYSFDGVDDRAQLTFRAIDPDGDIDIEFRTGPFVPSKAGTEYCIVSQCLTNNFANKEFRLYFNASENWIQGQVGAAYSPSLNGFKLQPNKHCRWWLTGSRLRVYEDGILRMDAVFNRGAAREPSAQTVIGAETHGNVSTYRAFASGMFYDLKINGTRWPLREPLQVIQLPEPSGLGSEAEPVNRFSNSSIGAIATQTDPEGFSVVTLNGSQTWSYAGFSVPVTPGETYIVETQADYQGTMLFYHCTDNKAQNAVQIGSFGSSIPAGRIVRHVIQVPNDASRSFMLITRNFTNAAAGIFKARLISCRPLGTCNPMTLINTNPDRWQEVDE